MQLPKTATDAELRMMFGFILCLLSLIFFAVERWRRTQAGAFMGHP